jgi:hypothetical protein
VSCVHGTPVCSLVATSDGAGPAGPGTVHHMGDAADSFCVVLYGSLHVYQPSAVTHRKSRRASEKACSPKPLSSSASAKALWSAQRSASTGDQRTSTSTPTLRRGSVSPERRDASLLERVRGGGLSPAKEGLSPAKEVLSPAKEVLSPAKEVSSPAKEVSSPAKEVSSPAKEVLSPPESGEEHKGQRVSRKLSREPSMDSPRTPRVRTHQGGWEVDVLPVVTGTGGLRPGTSRRKFGDYGPPTQAPYTEAPIQRPLYRPLEPKPALAEPRPVPQKAQFPTALAHTLSHAWFASMGLAHAVPDPRGMMLSLLSPVGWWCAGHQACS